MTTNQLLDDELGMNDQKIDQTIERDISSLMSMPQQSSIDTDKINRKRKPIVTEEMPSESYQDLEDEAKVNS